MRIGQSQLRIEDDALICGRGRYTDDLRGDGEATAVLVRSSAATGEIRSLDVSGALSCPGVLAVFTGEDLDSDGLGRFEPRLRFPGPGGGDMRIPDFRAMARGRVRYLGEPVAIVVAGTRAEAEDAAEAVVVEIDERPSVADCAAAVEPGAPRVWDEFEDNVSFVFEQGDEAATDAAFANAATVVSRRLRITRVIAAPIEPRAALARYEPEEDRYHLEIGTQAPHRIAADLAAILGTGRDRVRVLARDCGGSFGMKNVPFPEYAILLWAARRTGRSLRWTSSRLEAFQSDAHARDQWADASLALGADGEMLGLKVDAVANLGAYLGPSTPHSPTANVGGLAGVYRTANIHVRVRGALTNTQQTAAYRGAGRPEATYIIERMIDAAAAETGIDRVELRRRNLIGAHEMPFQTGLTFRYDSGDFAAVLDKALDLADWDGFAGRRAVSAASGRLRGIGIANPIEIAGGPAGKPNPEFARLDVDPCGSARLMVGSMDTGQGHGTAFRQILAETLGLDPARLTIVTGDTGVVPNGTGSFGSRTLGAAGTAIRRSADHVAEALRPRAAEMLEAAVEDIVFAEGRYEIVGTDRRIDFAAVLAASEAPASGESFASTDDATFPNGCHICEVEIDPETGETRLDRYVVVDDVGRVINPMLVKGQIIGGVAQGVGQGLMERVVYDDETGQLMSATFMDYAMPRACDLPSIQIETHAVETKANLLGVKGAGEAGTVGGLAVVMSAVGDALAQVGVTHLDMPATPERVWRAIHEARRVS